MNPILLYHSFNKPLLRNGESFVCQRSLLGSECVVYGEHSNGALFPQEDSTLFAHTFQLSDYFPCGLFTLLVYIQYQLEVYFSECLGVCVSEVI